MQPTDFKRLDWDAFATWGKARPLADYQRAYYAMYSSVWDAITLEPGLMTIPLDDHLVHRGDGLFETCKCAGWAVYNFDAHLRRLFDGARTIGLALPWGPDDIKAVCGAVLRAGGHGDALLRILVSRGPGGHGANPYECVAPQLYVLAKAPARPFMEAHPAGASVGISRLPVKPGLFARVKSVNYLPNALMKKEAVDRGCDFMAALDEDGHLAECPTETLMLVTRDGVLAAPRPDRILAGTTMLRVLELARGELARGGPLARLLRDVQRRDLSPGDARDAREILIAGTTPNVAAATTFDGRPVADGRPGPVQSALDALLAADMRDPARLWPVPT